MKIRKAQPELARILSEIAWESKRSWGYPDDWMQAWRDELTVSASVIKAGEVWALWDSGEPSGFYVLLPDGDGIGSLEHFWVRPESMGKGIGSELLRHALERAARAQYRSVKVVSDPNAEGFYLKHGAVRVGLMKGSVCGQQRLLPVVAFAI